MGPHSRTTESVIPVGGVTSGTVPFRPDDLVPLGDQSLHSLAFLLPHLDREGRDDLLQPGDMIARLVEVLVECGAELLRMCRLDHLGQCLHQLALVAVEVAELLREDVVE